MIPLPTARGSVIVTAREVPRVFREERAAALCTRYRTLLRRAATGGCTASYQDDKSAKPLRSSLFIAGIARVRECGVILENFYQVRRIERKSVS